MSDAADARRAPPPSDGEAPFIVTAGLPSSIEDHLGELRDRFFPPRPYTLPAHLTLLHAVPAAAEVALAGLLAELAARTAPIPLRLGGLVSLGRGFAVRVEAPALSALRRRLVRPLDASLTAQDRRGFRPHVTLANKLPADEARRRMIEASALWAPVETHVVALCRWRYLGGPWAPAGRWLLGAPAAEEEGVDRAGGPT